MSATSPCIELFAESIPASLLAESGKVFYSGRVAFASPTPLYVLGVNPGGDPAKYVVETVGNHTHRVLSDLPSSWSAYRDESWEGAAPGTYGMAPRVLHLFRRLQLDLGFVPASNLFFVRSRAEEHISERKAFLAELCWPFHALVLEKLRPRVILCLGGTAGDYVRKKVKANRVIGKFTEQNNRRWASQAFEAESGMRVVVATHPSRADWCARATDPSDLVREALR
jgi:hypothetical protein